ncbi:MAG: cadmium-translocating P-type ATPase [Bacteroidales bacterium]|nr:cadmium-translocating P-type ATPase [Bacteroidales bacterium]
MEKYKLKNLDCASCATKIEDSLSKMGEVKFVSVNFATASMTIETDELEKVKRKILEVEPEVELEIDGKKEEGTQSILSENKWTIGKVLIGLVLLLAGLYFEDELHNTPYHIAEYLVFVTAYLVSGWGVLRMAVKNIIRGQVFNEHFLMSIATLGAFAIHQMPEAVAVMLFYIVGELFQDVAVNRSRRSIKSLLEIKPDYANLKINGDIKKVSPEEVNIGDIIIVKAGEKVPLDGIVTEGSSFVDTSALTGESVPRKLKAKDEVLAGMINQSGLITVRVSRLFGESSISKILEMVENATAKKAETEKFITTFAKYYTPFVVFGSLAIAVLPPLLISGASFSDWIYRALVVLVISCPCALVISIPLGYFGGIGGASRRGILVKGSNFLDALTQVKTVVFDKTGTLTKGEFKVAEIFPSNGFDAKTILEYAAYAEYNSNHPIAKSLLESYHREPDNSRIGKVDEISGHGVRAFIDKKEVFVGNDKLLHKENIAHDKCDVEGTVVHVVIDKKYAGYIVIADSLKDDAIDAIRQLNKKGINTVMLTGDNNYAAGAIAAKLGIKKYYAELLPENKVEHIERLLNKNGKVAFVGDGINDAPVLARADVGIAMGALGSDAAIETADVVLMTDSPAKVAEAIHISKRTRRIVWQNIIFALGVKSVFIILGIFGIATMWEAVFGDMGVALIAILNATRILNAK